VLLILSTFVPWILTPLLMLGGAYLSYEGAHKVWEKLRGRHAERTDEPSQVKGKEAEDKVVRGAITTDFILSCEIMVISLNEVAAESLIARAIILVVVAIGITVLVYGAVALIVKMDDVGLAMTKKDGAGAQKVGHGLVAAMPRVLDGLAFIGTFAMLWVGGHILLVGLADLGVTLPYDLVHTLEIPLAGIAVVGGLLAWLVNTLCSMVLGFLVGSLVLGVISLTPLGAKGH
jgi:predicted DNA repair protein MutK